MDTVSCSRARQDLARLMDKVSDGCAAAIAVVMDLEECPGMEETIYLMRSPANARRLLRSVRVADRARRQR